MTINEANWQDKARSDGLVVQEVEEGIWAIKPAEGAIVELCPCCNRHMRTRRAAMAVAEIIFPLVRGHA